MGEGSLEEAILLALRRAPGSRFDELAGAVGLPRTNFGRRVRNRLREPVEALLAAELIEHDRGRYRLTASGRKRLSERFETKP
jgi:hypothetical protein